MKHENEKLGCSFEFPDKLTVRQQLAFWQRYNDAENAGSDAAKNWEAGKPLIENWTCEALPDVNTSLDDMTSLTQAQVVSWAGWEMVGVIMRLGELPNG